MVRTAEEAVLEYREALDDLKDNNKMQINLMTILAEDYSSFSREIVNVIARQVEKVLPTQKLAVMYVMDSILKNVAGAGNYKEHMEKIIVKLFVHVFETGDEKTRLALYKLRQTWTGIFQRSTLYKIDLAVNEIDPAWPIVTPQPVVVTQSQPQPQSQSQPQSSPSSSRLSTTATTSATATAIATTSSTSTTTTSSSSSTSQSSIPQEQQRPSSRVHVNPHFFTKGNTSNNGNNTAANNANNGNNNGSSVSIERRQLPPPTTIVEGRPMADPRLAKLANNENNNARSNNNSTKISSSTSDGGKNRPLQQTKSASFTGALHIKEELSELSGDVDERKFMSINDMSRNCDHADDADIPMKTTHSKHNSETLAHEKRDDVGKAKEAIISLKRKSNAAGTASVKIEDVDESDSDDKVSMILMNGGGGGGGDEKRPRLTLSFTSNSRRHDSGGGGGIRSSSQSSNVVPKPTNDLGTHAFLLNRSPLNNNLSSTSSSSSPSPSTATTAATTAATVAATIPPSAIPLPTMPLSAIPNLSTTTITANSMSGTQLASATSLAQRLLVTPTLIPNTAAINAGHQSTSTTPPPLSSSSSSGTPMATPANPLQHQIPSSAFGSPANPLQIPAATLLPTATILPTYPPLLSGASRLIPPPLVVPPSIGVPLASATTAPPPPIIRTETTKLDGIPANNRIFVDGRAYEVFYVNDVPVIERNSLPHRIYFTGAPRNVIIDGVAHLLNFGEEKRVVIDGEEHVLKFGAPSRELYMGNYPFKGAFGGPPIFATINGVRHEIRLGGPPPEVKIEPDPCYELLRHMPRQGFNPSASPRSMSSGCLQSSTPTSTQKEAATMDVKGLLEKLQKSGILSAMNAVKKDDANRDTITRSPTPPIPSEHRGEVTERLAKPPTDLKKFSMRALKIRYDSVVENLHQTRHLCPTCGLRFVELKGELYNRHLDWHFRENLKATEGSQCRAWFLSADDWLHFSEQEDLLASTSSAHIGGDSNQMDDGGDAGKVTANVSSDAVQIKECGVCGEKFEEYWDEDDDVWKLKECMLAANGKPFHPSCILDASIATQRTSKASMDEQQNEEEHASDQALLKAASRVLNKDFLLTR